MKWHFWKALKMLLGHKLIHGWNVNGTTGIVIPLGSCPECMGRSFRRVNGEKVCASCLARGMVVIV